MSDVTPERVDIDALAKLNLGLEVLGQRDDEFHEIATIFIAIDLVDHLTLTHDDDIRLVCDDPALNVVDNLARQALIALRQESGYGGGARLNLRKQIPSAAGLGGASSDAAAALLGARHLWCTQTPDDDLHALAARLGSDVPFFLRGGCALGRGRGEILAPLPVPGDTWFVVVAPNLTMPNKTASLYARLRPEDFSDGSRIAAQATRLASGLPLDPALLANAFTRPLASAVPALADLPRIMRAAGAATVALSGAGPAHYTPISSLDHARSIATAVRDRLGSRAQVFIAQLAPPRGPL